MGLIVLDDYFDKFYTNEPLNLLLINFQNIHGVAKRLRKMMVDFLREGVSKGKKSHLVSWTIIPRLKKKGAKHK